MRLISFLLLFLMLFFPIIVDACPHFDEDGNLFLLYYDSENYDIVIVEYPKNHYHQIYHYDQDENMIAEKFEIPFFAPMQIDYEVDIFTPVSDEPYYVDIDNLSVTGEKVRLDIDFSQTKENLMPKVDDMTSRLSYYINTKLINEDLHSNIYQKINNYNEEFAIEKLDADIFYIGASKKIMDQEWRSEEKTIRDFWDPVEVHYPLEDDLQDFMLLQIDSFNREVITIQKKDFQIEDDYIVFTANEESYYQITAQNDNFTTQEIINEDYEEDENVITDEDQSTNIMGVIILSIIGIIIVIAVLFFISKKQITITEE